LKIKGTPKLLAAQDIIRGDDRHVVRLTFLGEAEGKVKLDWEGAEFKWLTVSGIKKLKLLPGFEKALESVSALY
jgi:hypothetical protein